jgi:diacylglycerol kinase family enzyme
LVFTRASVYDAKGLIACLKQLLKAQSHSFDLWDVGGKATLVSYLSAGLDASVIRNFDQARKLGKLQGGSFKNKLYYLKSFCSQLHYRLPEGSHARIETSDGVFELPLAGRRAFLAANINSYAAGAHPFSGGRFDDGVLEIAVFASVWKYIFVTVGSRSYPTVAQWMRRKLRWYRAYTVTLTLPTGTPVQLDGEDFTSAAQESAITISFAARVQLLDLRRSFYALF